MGNRKKLIVNLIKSFFVAFAWMNLGGLESTSILLLCVFGSALLILSYKHVIVSEDKKKERVASTLLGALFTVLYALYADLTGGLENKLFVIVYVLCTVIGLFVMFSELIHILINKAGNITVKKKLNKSFNIKSFLIYSGIIFVCILPFFALNYPGVMTPDSLYQLFQNWGIDPWSNHHPWIHTALIGLFYNIGYAACGSVHGAIAFYTVFQMIIVSISMGYALESFEELGVKKGWIIGVMVAFIILPYNMMYAVTIWKDILFSMAVLVFNITIMRLEFTDSLRDKVLFIVSGIGVCLLRHNGFYAFVATAVIWLIANGKRLKKYIACSLIVLLVAILCRGPLMKACNVEPAKYVFNLHIPLQQIGRVIVEGGELTDYEENWLKSINSFDFIKAGYSTQGADTMTAWVIAGDYEFFDSHHSDFYKIWASIGLRYPMSYINAFLDITAGYWAPMNPQQTVFFGITSNDQELYAKPIIEGPVLIKINELITKLYGMIPVYGFMYCMGGYFWIFLIFGAICIVNNQRQKLCAFLPLLMLTFTLFVATPLVADLRYAYATMVVLPFLIMYTFIRAEE